MFDGFQAQLAANRAQFYRDVAGGPVLRLQPAGREASRGVIQNWWRQGMMGGAKAHYDGIVAFSQTDFTEDLKKITVPVLVMHGEDDQIVPYADCRTAVGEAAEERHAENLQGLSARHADHRSGHHQRRPAGVHQGVTPPAVYLPSKCRRLSVSHSVSSRWRNAFGFSTNRRLAMRAARCDIATWRSAQAGASRERQWPSGWCAPRSRSQHREILAFAEPVAHPFGLLGPHPPEPRP